MPIPPISVAIPEPPTAAARQALLQQVVSGVNATKLQYSTLFRSGINPQPILYFNDPLTAEFATFGVNPSAKELSWKRWPIASLTPQQLDARLVNYFTNQTVPAHPWFDGYEKPLSTLGHSYRLNTGNTVHLDLSPRATKAMSTVDPKLFRQMIAADMQWFLSALTLCRNVKGAIMSGSVTGKYYFDEFLKAYLPPSHSLKLRLALGPKLRGATALYDLIGPKFNIPVFFVSTSPSGDKGVRLASETQRNLPTLRTAGF